jgi:hypothetical protein
VSDNTVVTDPAQTSSNAEKFEPGSIKINSAIIIANNRRVDVTNLISKIVIYENIMCPFITGAITLTDTTALGQAFPLIGEELLVLDIETPRSDDFDMRRENIFHLYKMEGRENAAEKKVMFTLHFMSIEAYVDMNTKISQTFKGKISDTVKTLISTNTGLKTNKNVAIEPTTNDEIYTSNFWTPIENIYYCALRAINYNNNPNYVFFEGNEGFIFASIDALYSGVPIQIFKKDQASRQEKSVENIQAEYQKVLDMSTPVFYDYIERLQQGYYGGAVYHFDIQNKILNFAARVGKDDFKKVQLNENETMGNLMQFHPYGQMKTQIIHKELYKNSPVLPIDHGLQRMSLLKRTESLVTTIEVLGRLDYTVGRTVDLIVYQDRSVSKEETDVTDKVLSGRYLITSVTHDITGTRHLTFLELAKDTIQTPVEQVA